MRIEFIIKGKIYLSEEVGSIETNENIPFNERCMIKEAVVKLYIDMYKYKYEHLRNIWGSCDMWVVFESKMNDQ